MPDETMLVSVFTPLYIINGLCSAQVKTKTKRGVGGGSLNLSSGVVQ